MKRWDGEPPECYRGELDRLISIATEESLGSGAVIRMIKNGFTPARYFISEHWRFVTNEEATKIMTIERPYMTGRRPNKKMRNKNRYGK